MPWKSKEDKAVYMREYRKRMSKDQKAKARKKVSEREREIQAWFVEIKSGERCRICGEDHPACLEYHHLDPSTKEVNIYDAVWHKGWSKERILSEMAKCEVLCCNCHKKLHWATKTNSAFKYKEESHVHGRTDQETEHPTSSNHLQDGPQEYLLL